MTCELACELKGRTSLKLGDLQRAPENCPYINEMKKATVIPVEYFEGIHRSLQPILEMFQHIEGLEEVYHRVKDFEEFYSKQQEAISRAIGNLLLPEVPFKDVEPLIKQMSVVSEYFSRIPQSYYGMQKLERLYKPLPVARKRESLELTRRLTSCLRGHEYSSEFQAICRDTLSYLFVPPLGQPVEESRTDTGLQRRDIVIPIPYDAEGFWFMLRQKHQAEALIVDCKNYSGPIEANEIVVTSKYLGERRLGLFAVIISRCEPAESAVKEIKRLWLEEGKMIVCLDDASLKAMIALKEDGEDPELLLDRVRFDFLQSLE